MSFSSSARCTEAYLKPRQISKMGRFAKIINIWMLLTIFPKCSYLDVWQVSKYASVILVKVSLFPFILGLLLFSVGVI